jgi:hypothetical protein
MSGSYESTHALPQVGCRTLCQYPGCGQPIEVAEHAGTHYWVHVHEIPAGVGPHYATPIDPSCSGPPEPGEPGEYPAQRLVASVTESYERHLAGRPVRALDIERMAERMCTSQHDRTERACRGDVDSPTYQRAVRAHDRRRKALRRLAQALERQEAVR